MESTHRPVTRPGQWARLTAAYDQFVMPSVLGLPNWRVVAWFPLLAALGSIVLIMLNISGSSSGAHWAALGSGEDPRLIYGVPRGIRSDEWLVQQGWIVSQAERGFPAINEMFPGGTDMTVLNELPSWDWSSLFRPHLWGYLLFGLHVGVAWQWWIPALILASGTYLLAVTLLPRRPITSALIAIALFFTPFLQWWYSPSSFMSVAWPLLAMAGVVWTFVDRRRWVRILWAVVIGYFAVTLAMGLYVPFIIPGLLVFLAFAVGYLLRVRPWSPGGPRLVFARLAPLLLAAGAALAVTGVWVVTRWSTFDAIQSTVYPGQRSSATGGLLGSDPLLTGFGSAPWSQALKATSSMTILGPNSSEASSVILLSLFIAPGLVWFVVRSFRRTQQIDWLLLAVLAAVALIAAYLFVPGWDAVAHVLQLDRVQPDRFRIAFVVLLPLFAILAIDHVDTFPTRKNWIVGLVSGAVAALVLLTVALRIRADDPTVLALAPTWRVIAVLIVVATTFFFVRRAVPVAAALLLVASVLMGWGVNPLYRGVLDLSETAIGSTIDSIDEAEPGTWVGVGSFETMAVLVESGAQSLSGVQTYPPTRMWEAIDPSGDYEQAWNRLGHLDWELGGGEPAVRNPQADVIAITFDPCSEFAQQNVDYILSDEEEYQQPCLTETTELKQGALTMRIYEVVPAVG
jgi:hypothetical protein